MKKSISKLLITINYYYIVFLFILLTINSVKAQEVSTLAGSGVSAFADGTGVAASFSYPKGIAVDALGNVYVADQINQRIRMITPAGLVSTLAGSGVSGFADGTGSAASFSAPSGVAVDASGKVYVADANNNRIRMITPAGVVTTFAGSGSTGSSDGTGTVASFNFPRCLAIDASGNLYVADTFNNKIRMITPGGEVSTLAGSGTNGFADGTGALASFNYPEGLAVDASGNVYVADGGNNKIRMITPAGVVSTLAGSGVGGSSDGTGVSASFNAPVGVAVASSGDVYVADYVDSKIRIITPAGVVSTLAGSGTYGFADGTGAAASFDNPFGIAVYGSGNVYVADGGNNKIRMITLIPEIKISQAGTELISGSTSYDFGTVNALSTSSVITFTIEDKAFAGKALSLTGTPIVALSGANTADFSVDISSTSSSIAVGSSTTFTITFSPLSSGAKSATVTILNDDINEATYTFTITGTGVKINQTISGLADVSKTYGTSFNLAGTASSSLALSYSSSNTSIATITGNTVTAIGVGSTTITASQSGDNTYNAATDVTFVLSVTQAPLIITADDKTKVYGAVNPILTESYSGFVNGDDASTLGCAANIQTTAITTSASGVYPIIVSDCGYTNANYSFTFVNGTLTITVSTAIENSAGKVGLCVFPNPTLGEITITVPVNLQITVYNAQGIKLLEQSIPEGNTILSLEKFKAGLYILHYTDGNNISQQYRIVKN